MGRRGRDGAETATAKQRRVWDRAAPSYDRQMGLFDRIWFAGGREWLAERAHGRVLEVGIGTGLMLPHYPADVRLTGVELSPAMLELAGRRAVALGRPVELIEGDAEHLPVDEASYDVVVSALALCTIPDPPAALAEMHRALVPGGTLLLLDHVRSSWPPVLALQWLVERVTVPLAGEHFTRRQLPLLAGVGFEVVETQRLKLGTIERVRAMKAG